MYRSVQLYGRPEDPHQGRYRIYGLRQVDRRGDIQVDGVQGHLDNPIKRGSFGAEDILGPYRLLKRVRGGGQSSF